MGKKSRRAPQQRVGHNTFIRPRQAGGRVGPPPRPLLPPGSRHVNTRVARVYFCLVPLFVKVGSKTLKEKVMNLFFFLAHLNRHHATAAAVAVSIKTAEFTSSNDGGGATGCGTRCPPPQPRKRSSRRRRLLLPWARRLIHLRKMCTSPGRGERYNLDAGQIV